MREHINEHLRKTVAEHAKNRCEYCLIHEDDTYSGCHIDHIISIKHGGASDEDNLAYACAFCNRFKGSDVGSIIWDTGEFVRFFNPRKDHWTDHFIFDGEWIQPLSNIGQATLQILKFNDPERVEERKELIAKKRYPIPPFYLLIKNSNEPDKQNLSCFRLEKPLSTAEN